MYYVSWSLPGGEATFTRCFTSAVERDRFAARLGCRNVQTWNREAIA